MGGRTPKARLRGSSAFEAGAVASYRLVLPFSGALGETRTHDPLLRRQVLYPLSYERIGDPSGI